MAHKDNIVKRRINRANSDASLSIPANVRHQSVSTFYSVEVVEDGCLLYRPINVDVNAVPSASNNMNSAVEIPTKEPAAELLTDHIHEGGVVNE